MTKVIGHRGAKGLALENTLAGFDLAQKLGVDAIEFDVRRTRDGQFVVSHDDHLHRVSDSRASIKHLTYDELHEIVLHNGEFVPLLHEALAAIENTPVVIEIKIRKHTEEICAIVSQFPNLTVSFASFKREVVADCVRLRPDVPTFLLSGVDAFGSVRTARSLHAAGIGLRFWLMNPFTYFFARMYGLKMYVYTVNRPWVVRLLLRFYPGVDICTNLPDDVQALRDARADIEAK
ncbi:MAG TPA: glycerophosphodiester phosphodiesterase [Candidatus Saccharimonadales bacterium]